MCDVDIYIPWATARNILCQIDSDEFINAVRWIKDSRGVNLRCAKQIAGALRDGDFIMEDCLADRRVRLTAEIESPTLA